MSFLKNVGETDEEELARLYKMLRDAKRCSDWVDEREINLKILELQRKMRRAKY